MLARLLGLTCRCTRDLAYEPPAVCGECGRWSRSPWGHRLGPVLVLCDILAAFAVPLVCLIITVCLIAAAAVL